MVAEMTEEGFTDVILKIRTNKNININGYKAVTSACYSYIEMNRGKKIDESFCEFLCEEIGLIFGKLYNIAISRLSIDNWNNIGVILLDLASQVIRLSTEEITYIHKHLIGNYEKIYEKV